METRELSNLLQKYLFGYQKAINEGRAIPDATTGLKIVHQRTLWACLAGGYTSNKEYKKSARIVGDIIGKYHPHGDTAAYEAMVRLAQPWKMRYPLIDLYGNMGNIDGDGPAAMRYTNARLAKLAEDGLLYNIKKNNVDFIPNYDEDEEEPVSLPAYFPNLLCNPNEGIGWAMACEWLPHNLVDVYNAINDFLEGKEPMLPGPDFPLGGEIINAKDMPGCYRSGKGTVRIRARYNIEKDCIVFYEIPYGTNTESLIDKIKEVAKADIPEIREVINESSDKVRLVIKCEKGTNLDSVANRLYNKTPLQTTASFNQVALVNGKPKLINLKECIEIYVAHNVNCIIREAQFDLDKAQARLHIVDGLLKALEDIDNIIALIKKSASAAAAKEALIAKYNFSDIQAKAILDMKLAKLANLEKIELQNEAEELKKTIDELNTLISNPDYQIAELKKRLSELVKKYGDERRTVLNDIEIPKTKAEKEIVEVVPEDCVVVTSANSMIKRIPTSSFKVQKRNTKGTKTSDLVLDIVKTNTVDTMLFFTDSGKMYRCVVDKIPAGTNSDKGTYIGDIIKIEGNENIVAVSSLHRKSTPKYVIFFTKNGLIKKSLLAEYMKSSKSGGLQAIKIADGDAIVKIVFQDDEDDIIITKNGMGIRVGTTDINAVGRIAMGVKGIKLKDGDEVVAALPVHKDTDMLALFAGSGLGKKMPLSEMTKQGRGGTGVIVYKDEKVAGAAMVSDDDNILISGTSSSVVISAQDVPTLGRTSAGNIMIKGGNIKSISKI